MIVLIMTQFAQNGYALKVAGHCGVTKCYGSSLVRFWVCLLVNKLMLNEFCVYMQVPSRIW
jgi:hypothetical protein